MRLPHHSTVLSSLALFVALGGTSYAAVKLPANSVTSKQIKPRSIQVSDLALKARPIAKARIAQTVEDVLADPTTQVNIHVVGEKGDKGDPGAAVQGPAGATGGTGRPGEARAYGHAYFGGSWDQDGTSSNVKIERANTDLGDGVRHFCINMLDGSTPRNITTTVDADDPNAPAQSAPISARVAPHDGPCAGASFEVLTARSFFFAIN